MTWIQRQYQSHSLGLEKKIRKKRLAHLFQSTVHRKYRQLGMEASDLNVFNNHEFSKPDIMIIFSPVCNAMIVIF